MREGKKIGGGAFKAPPPPGSYRVKSFLMYSGGKKNPDLPIKSTENLNMTCRHCKCLLTTRVGKMPAFMSKVHAGGIYRYLLAFTGIY